MRTVSSCYIRQFIKYILRFYSALTLNYYRVFVIEVDRYIGQYIRSRLVNKSFTKTAFPSTCRLLTVWTFKYEHNLSVNMLSLSLRRRQCAEWDKTGFKEYSESESWLTCSINGSFLLFILLCMTTENRMWTALLGIQLYYSMWHFIE